MGAALEIQYWKNPQKHPIYWKLVITDNYLSYKIKVNFRANAEMIIE